MIYGDYRNGKFTVMGESFGLNTICSFHAFITDALGFSDNGKTSGLAAYGEVQPKLKQELLKLLTVSDKGIHFHRERFSRSIVNLANVKPTEFNRAKILNRVPSETNVLLLALEYLPHDLARTGEHVLQQIFLEFLRQIRPKLGLKRCVFSGGLFQNIALNNRIHEDGPFEEVFVPMATSDAGFQA